MQEQNVLPKRPAALQAGRWRNRDGLLHLQYLVAQLPRKRHPARGQRATALARERFMGEHVAALEIEEGATGLGVFA